MAPKQQRASSSSQRRGRGPDESSTDMELSVNKSPPNTPKPNKQKDKAGKDKDKEKDKGTNETTDGQQTIDKHLITSEKKSDDQLDDTLKGFSETLKKLASQEYIESKFKEMVTEKFLSSKLKELQNDVKMEVKKEIESVHKHVAAMKDRVDKAEKTIVTLRNKVSDMETSMEKLAAENILIKKENERMREQLTERETKLKVQSEEINSLEQYTRRNSVRIYGIDDRNKRETDIETARHVVKLAKDKLQIDISTADIDIAHRMGAFKEDANRPIICKFVSRFTKNELVKSRRKLKGSSIVIREDLTYQNAKLLEKTKASDSVKSAWTDDGKIIALLNNDKKVVINWKTDLSKL